MILLVIVLTALSIKAQVPIDCSRSPTGMLEVCRQLQEFDVLARRNVLRNRQRPRAFASAPGVPSNPSLSPAVPSNSFNPSIYDCMDMQCLCPYFRGGLSPDGNCILMSGMPLRRAVRKEIRAMSEDELNRFNTAIRQLKMSGEYDRLSRIHRQMASGTGAHSGPAFLPWHRELLKRFEIALRLIDPSVSIPYWDSVMDSYLPDPRDSIMWSPFLAGENDEFGQVVNGPYGNRFRTLEGNPYITRRLGVEGHLFTEKNLRDLYNKQTIEGVLAYTAPQRNCQYPPNFGALEYSHASVHLWVGGDMKPPARSANDPVFFFHHSFVDFIFEQWRQMRQNRWQREHEYSPNIEQCASPLHFSNAPMRPFNLINIQGLSNGYTDNMYTFAPRPACSASQPSCNSRFLFCDLRGSFVKCVSKVKMNGNCRGLEGLDACYRGICVNGVCRPGATTMFTQTRSPMTSPTRTMTPSRAMTSVTPLTTSHRLTSTSALPNTNSIAHEEGCFNDDPCCSLWAQRGQCRANLFYMTKFCKRSCGICRSQSPRNEGCIDRHISCQYWSSHGECFRKRQWMSENCQRSCGWCRISKIVLCTSVARLSRM